MSEAASPSPERRDRYTAWGLTWLTYATYYTGRKGFSVAKKAITEHLGVSVAALGLIDTVYLAAYAIGQFVSGTLGDRIGARRLIGYGMLLSAAACAAFGSMSSALLFGVLFCINGFAQSTGWPGTTRAMAEWTTPKNRGSVMAFWATCYQVGGVAATALAGYLLGRYGWRAAFYGPALWIAIVAVLVLLLLKPGPSATRAVVADAELPLDGSEPPPSSTRPLEGEELLAVRRRAQREILRSPVLWSYGLSYFFIKLIRYSLLFWLPFYLAKQLGYSETRAAYVSTAFDVGGIAGVIVIGILSDRLRRVSRSLLSALWLFGLAAALFAYARLGTSAVGFNVAMLGLIGAMLFGPDSLISGAAAQDAGGPHAAAMATGFVDGVGSIGAVLEGLLVPWISKRFGWHSLFIVFVVCAIAGGLCLLPTSRRVPAPRTD